MKARLLIMVLALQTVVIAGLAFWHESALHTGIEILLETAPVDPRDLLRGDYVILSYKVGAVRRDRFISPPENDVKAGRDIWVALKKPGEFYEVDRASFTPLVPDSEEVVLRGKTAWAVRDSVQVEYGLERYYVREGTGNPRGKLTVKAVVAGSGRAQIKEVFLNGKPYVDAMRGMSQ
ncbi:MAG TPA: GDYXXLXY domain-containing protein [Candidatus Limnocylindria bacterium]|nr:GDYXXLXY domain-containing protein [Candidatus Limnocylindria bacterium]